MCGILAVHGIENPGAERPRFVALSKRIRHRGPDWSGCFVGKEGILLHERLAIVGVGASPVFIIYPILALTHRNSRYRRPTSRQRGRSDHTRRQW